MDIEIVKEILLHKDAEWCESPGDNFTGVGFFLPEDVYNKLREKYGITETIESPKA